MSDKTIRTVELDNVKKATAMMFAAIIDTLVGTDSPQAKVFDQKLDQIYHHIRDDTDDLNALELLSWTRNMITGFSRVDGQGAPLMKRI